MIHTAQITIEGFWSLLKRGIYLESIISLLKSTFRCTWMSLFSDIIHVKVLNTQDLIYFYQIPKNV